MANRIGALGMRELEDLFVSILRNCRNIEHLKKVHAQIVRCYLSQRNFLVAKMVAVCDGFEEMGYASFLFRQVKDPNGFLFNAMIRAYAHNTMYERAIDVYRQMLSFKDMKGGNLILPDKFTFPFLLKSCAGLLLHCLGKQVHGHLCKFGPNSHLTTENALIDMYAKCDNLLDARQVFDGMTERDPISWNTIISGHVRLGQMKKARAMFDAMSCRTVVSWTAIISGNASVGYFADALAVFRSMQDAGVEPDEISVISVLPACAQLGALEVGKWIHMYCRRHGLLRKTSVCNALIEMYSKCGCIDQAWQLFDQMSDRDVISWSTMIGGLANHGKALEAVDLFERMKQTKVEPNAITFLGLLSAFTHAGLWNEGLSCFDSMKRDYHLEPEIEHYGSLIDLLGRAGRLHQALGVIEKMPMEPDSKIWGSLLSSCRAHRNLEIALITMEHLEKLEPDDTGNYVLLSNIYADYGKWEDVSMMRKLIRSKSTRRTPGCSLIEVNNMFQEFVSSDDSKPVSQEIFGLLKLINLHGSMTNHTNEIALDEGAECLR